MESRTLPTVQPPVANSTHTPATAEEVEDYDSDDASKTLIILPYSSVVILLHLVCRPVALVCSLELVFRFNFLLLLFFALSQPHWGCWSLVCSTKRKTTLCTAISSEPRYRVSISEQAKRALSKKLL